jgi:transposase
MIRLRSSASLQACEGSTSATDLLGRPLVLQLSPGNMADIRMAPALLAAVGRYMRPIANRGYDAAGSAASSPNAARDPSSPRRRNRTRTVHHDPDIYQQRWRIEAAARQLKDFRRVATCYDKLANDFLSAIILAAITASWLFRGRPLATVTVRTRIDSAVVAAHFTEGQEVKMGGLLFTLDDRPMAAALRGGEANLAKDQAQVDQAKLTMKKLLSPGEPMWLTSSSS